MDNEFARQLLIEGEIVDTYGGDFTYRDVWAVDDCDNGIEFYQQCYGAKPGPVEQIYSAELMEIYRFKYDN